MDLEKINIGCMVKLFDMEFNEEVTYKLVGSTEADIFAGKISNESPLGHALIGCKIGEVVEVEGPDGAEKYRILDIQRSNL